MNSKIKLILMLLVFALLIGGSTIIYNNLSKAKEAEAQITEGNNADDEDTVTFEESEEKEASDTSGKIIFEGEDPVDEEVPQIEFEEEEGPPPENTEALKNVKDNDFKVLDMDNNEVRLSDKLGKPIVLNFWASWCPPCKAEMPHFQKLYDEFGDEVEFMMVDAADGYSETIENGKSYIEGEGYSFPVYFDDKLEAVGAYGISGFPTTFFIDSDGNFVATQIGALSEEMLAAGIEKIK